MPGLAVVLVGDDPASRVYVAEQGRGRPRELGFHSVQHDRPVDDQRRPSFSLSIETLNRDPAIHGILVQLPLPAHIDEARVIEAILPGEGRRRLPSRSMPGGSPSGLGARHGAVHAGGLHDPHPARARRAISPGGPRSSSAARTSSAGRWLNSSSTRAARSRSPIRGRAICRRRCAAARSWWRRSGGRKWFAATGSGRGPTVIDVGMNRIAAPERGRGEDQARRRRCLRGGRAVSPGR